MFTSGPDLSDEPTQTLVLYSKFKPRKCNTEQYDNKMKFWIDKIYEYCIQMELSTFCIRDLQLRFKLGDQIPACLDDVILHMKKQKLIRPLWEYEYDPLNTWSGWVTNCFFRTPIQWTKKVIGTVHADTRTTEWIHLDVLKKCCDTINTKVFSCHAGNVYQVGEFRELCNTILKTNESCLNLCLQTMYAHKKIGLKFDVVGGKKEIALVKIPSKINSDIHISPSEDAALELNLAKANLSKQIEKLDDELISNNYLIRQHIKENNKKLAKIYLRRKHVLESSYEKQIKTKYNIEMLLAAFKEAEQNDNIIDAYKVGSKALKDIVQKLEKKYDSVQDVLSDVFKSLEDLQESHDEMLATNSFHVPELLDEQLQRELEELTQADADCQMNAAGTADEDNKANPLSLTTIVIADQKPLNDIKQNLQTV